MSQTFNEICSLIGAFEKARVANDRTVIFQLNAIEDKLFEQLSAQEQYQYGLVAMAHFLKSTPEDIDKKIVQKCGQEDIASKTTHLLDWNYSLTVQTMLSSMHDAVMN